MSGPARHFPAAVLLAAIWRILCATAALLSLSTAPAHSQSVQIVDPNLEAAVREALQKTGGELTLNDMAELEVLVADRRGITTINGFRGATNLVELDLRFNDISELLLPSDLPSLHNLRLRGNPLEQFAASAPMSRLRRLNLSECLLTNVDFLPAFPGLSVLEIQANDLGAFHSLAMTNLSSLDLAYNRVRDLSFLTNLPALTHLIMDDNGLTNVVLPGTLSNLTFLSLTVNRIRDLSFLRELPNLEVLDLASNFSTNYVFPAGLTRLQWLNLGENRLTSLFFPPDMTNLLSLYLDDNRFTSVPFLSPLTALRVLDLGMNPLTTVTVPHTLTNLWHIDVSFNPLQAIIVPDVVATDRVHQVSFTLDELRAGGVAVHVYPVLPRLSLSRAASGDLHFVFDGPPGTHRLEGTESFQAWSPAGRLTNVIGTVEGSLPMSSGRQMFRTALP